MKTDRPAAPKTACTFWQAVILLALALLIILCGNLALHLNTALTLLLSAFVSFDTDFILLAQIVGLLLVSLLGFAPLLNTGKTSA